jgi:allantoate deiminase
MPNKNSVNERPSLKVKQECDDKHVQAAKRALERCDILASHSAMQDGVLRAYLTPQHKQAHGQLAEWMAAAGLTVWQDAVGNQWGRKVSDNPTQPTLMLGSHSDTVVDAGKYDGTLGVIMAIEVLSGLRDVELPYHVDVVAFADEEGTRFNTTLLGSSAVAGCWNSEWLNICDADGISMEQALIDFGLDPDLIPTAARHPQDLLGYLEVHIEQGPLLESEQLAVGVVTAIAGAKRFIYKVGGQAGHAGTVPIHLRQDAFCAVAEMTLCIEQFAKQHLIVATVGRCDIAHSAVNVIPGLVEFSLDIRSQDQRQLEWCSEDLARRLVEIAEKRQVSIHSSMIYQAQAVPCCGPIIEKWRHVVTTQTGVAAKLLPSGAGHDAMVMARVTDIGMLFIRCDKGISHNPLENVQCADVAIALACFEQMVAGFTARLGT